MHPAYPGLLEVIANAQGVVTDIARWLGTVGAYVVGLDTPDCQRREDKPRPIVQPDGVRWAASLELIDIPALPRDGELWRPRILHCEAKNIAKDPGTGFGGQPGRCGVAPGAPVVI